MTNEQLTRIIEAIDILSKETDTDGYEIVNQLKSVLVKVGLLVEEKTRNPHKGHFSNWNKGT